MKRHRVLRNSSTHSLCIFCAFRLSGQQVAPAASSSRRHLHDTRRADQQAVAYAQQAQTPPGFAFDPNSNLTLSEQKSKAARLQKLWEAEEARTAARREEERLQHERQVREFRAREEEAKVRREEEDARRTEAKKRQDEVRGTEVVQRGGRGGQRGGGQQQQQQGRDQRGYSQRRLVLSNNAVGAAPAGQHNGRGDRDGRVSQSLSGVNQAPHRTQPNARSASPFEAPPTQQVPGRPTPRQQQNGQRAPNQQPQKLSRPTFGGASQEVEEMSGWGMGSVNIKPVQHKTDEQIQQEKAEEVERQRQELEARRKKQRQGAAELRQRRADAEVEQERREKREREQQERRAQPQPGVQQRGRGEQRPSSSAPQFDAKPAWEADAGYAATLRQSSYPVPTAFPAPTADPPPPPPPPPAYPAPTANPSSPPPPQSAQPDWDAEPEYQATHLDTSYDQSPQQPPSRSQTAPAWEAEGEYQAIPFSSTDYQSQATQTSNEAWQSPWQHLAPRKQEQIPPPPPPPQQNVAPSYQPAYRPPFLDEAAIDRNFQQHKRERDMRAQSPFSSPNIFNAPSSQPAPEVVPRRELRCFRCQEKGHHAKDCTAPMVCKRCGQPGHVERFCKQPQTKIQQAKPQQGALRDQQQSVRQPGNFFRRTVVETPEYMLEKEKVSQPEQEDWTYRTAQRAPEPRQANAYDILQEKKADKPAVEPSVTRDWSAVEEEPDQNTEEEDRQARRRKRWVVEEEDVEEAPAPKQFERRGKEGRVGRRRERDEDDDDEAMAAREERAARKAAKKAQERAENDRKKAARAAGERAGGGTQVHLPEFVSVSNLAQQLGIGYEPFVQRLEQLGYDDVFPGKVLNREISGMIAMEYDFDPVYEGAGAAKSEEEERDLKAAPEVEDTTFLPTRPPVVTIMGHVDHGKTTILDYLRRTSVAAGEAGGITQHIGAFSVPLSASGRTVTFLDTPGHAAFMSMRQRGANVTDIVILVVAADDSVKPQTLESIRCAREADVPMIVAVNKVDKPEADVQRVKNDLSRHGVEIEDFGGEVQVVEVSGKTGQGLDALEENIVTLSEILDHRSNTEGAVEGWVLEAMTKRAGRVATVLVKRGTLRPGAILVAGKTWARVRSLRDEREQSLMEVGPGMPVEVDGWRDQPNAGDEVLQAPGEQKATDVVAYRLEKGERVKMEEDMEAINEARRLEQEKRKAAEKAAKAAAIAAAGSEEGTEAEATVAETSSTESTEESQGQQTIPFIIKADVSGSAEAVAAYIPSLTAPLIAPEILHSSVGAINESDIELASASGGHIVAFNLGKNEDMRGLAESKGVSVLENDVIYRMLEQVKEVLEARLPEIVRQRVLGEAEVGTVFEISLGGRKKVKVAGCKVRNGVVGRNAKVRVTRGGEKVYDGVITSLKNVKKDVQEMRKGTECGMGFEGWEGFQEGDQVQTYEQVREKRKL